MKQQTKAAQPRKPYQKPQLRSSATFERMALTCTGANVMAPSGTCTKMDSAMCALGCNGS